MDAEIKQYIDSLDKRDIPWDRMFTAYGTAEKYCALLSVLEETSDLEQWKTAFNQLSDFEHQSTFFPPAPFALVFLVRILRERLQAGADDGIVETLIDHFLYYAGLCGGAEKMEHARPLSRFADLLNDANLLPEDWDEEDLMEVFEDPDAVSDSLFYSFYYYAGMVLSQVPAILDQCGRFPEESRALRARLGDAQNGS